MNTPPKRPPYPPQGGPRRFPGAPPEPDDLSIPVLTERLGLPPLEFDTTLPMIETTGQMVEPMLEGLTALPDAPVPQVPPSPVSAAGLHPIAAIPFPPIAFPEDPAPVVAKAPSAPAMAIPALKPAAPIASPPMAPPAPLPPATVTLATTDAPAIPALAVPALPVAVAPSPPAPVATTAAAAPSANPAAASATASAATGGQHWGRIEVELRSSILRQITEQLPREIDGIVQGRMQDAIDRLLTSLAEEIHLAVTASLADIVERAVRAELDRMRNSNRG